MKKKAWYADTTQKIDPLTGATRSFIAIAKLPSDGVGRFLEVPRTKLGKHNWKGAAMDVTLAVANSSLPRSGRARFGELQHPMVLKAAIV